MEILDHKMDVLHKKKLKEKYLLLEFGYYQISEFIPLGFFPATEKCKFGSGLFFLCRVFGSVPFYTGSHPYLPSSQFTQNTGWPNKKRTFLRYHIFAATTDIIMRFLLKYSEITAENNKRIFLKTSVK